MQRKLFRSRTDRKILGVCGGLAKYFDMDPVIVRVIMILLIFVNGLGILAYVILAIVVPIEEPESEIMEEGITVNPETKGADSMEQIKGEHPTISSKVDDTNRSISYERNRYLIGIVMIIAGIFFMLGHSLGHYWWWSWGFMWPLIVIAIGLLIVFSSKR